MDKLKLAHDWAMKSFLTNGFKDESERATCAWQYADAMQAEAEKREDKTRPEVLEEWQPDWSQAPDEAKYWAMDKDGLCNWYENKPEICDDQWDFGDAIEVAPQFTYTSNWQDSLRKRPQ